MSRGLIRGLVAAALAVACAPGLSGPAAAAKPGLSAGAASVAVSLPGDTPLAGYGGFPRRAWLPDVLGRFPDAFWFRPSTGVHDPFTVRALVLESGSIRLLWLAADLVAIDPSLVAELRERLAGRGIRYSAVVVSASHTHSGPGAYADSGLFAFVAVDRLSRAVRDRVLDGMERAARDAEARRRPALSGAGHAEVGGIARSRVGGGLDPELGVLRVDGVDGRPVAVVWNYAIHGTALGRGNLLLSGDLMGDAAERLERAVGAPALYVNGAVGDVSPRHHGWAGVAAAGGALAGGALEAWRGITPEAGARLAVVTERLTLGAPAVSLKNCLGGWAPAAAKLGLSAALPSTAEVLAVRIGRAALVTIPGELETRLGLEVKAAGRGRFGQTFVAGVSNDYLGYFLTPEHYRQPSYIACGSLYGDRGGELVRDAAVTALRRLPGGTRRR